MLAEAEQRGLDTVTEDLLSDFIEKLLLNYFKNSPIY